MKPVPEQNVEVQAAAAADEADQVATVAAAADRVALNKDS
jgi:hypothetical protein